MSTLEWIFGGMSLAELVTLITTIVMLRPQRQKADEEVNQARATTRGTVIENDEKSTKLLMEYIVEPLKKEITSLRREIAALKRAVQKANSCKYHDGCPVLHDIQAQAEVTEGKEEEDVL